MRIHIQHVLYSFRFASVLMNNNMFSITKPKRAVLIIIFTY